MISLAGSFLALLAGYLIYGRVVEKTFRPDGRETPAFAKRDGVDFIPMPTWKAFLVQLLNIAGTGPIYGALMGACFGPVVFLWIVLGSVLGGGVHDYMSGMISERHDGASIAELSGVYLGQGARWGMRAFSVLLLLLTGTVFVTTPAALLSRLTPDTLNSSFWVATAYLLKSGARRRASLLTALPATFMSAVSMTYILMAAEGFGLGAGIGYPAGAAFAAALFAAYCLA